MLSDINPLDPLAWRLDHALMPVVLVLTIVAGHLVLATARTFRFIACIGWLVVAVVGTVVTLYSSLGRQNDNADRQIKMVEDHNSRRADVTKQMIATGKLLDAAMSAQALRCGSNPDGDSCRGARSNVRAFTSAIEHNQQQLQKIGPEQTAAPKATVLAATVVLFVAVDEQLLRKRIMALEPFLFTVLFEIGSIVAFSFAFGGLETATVATVVPKRTTVAPVNTGVSEPNPPQASPPVPPKQPRRRPATTEVQARAVVTQLRVIDNQQALADRLKVNKGTVSRWLDKWEAEGLVTREPDGRCNVVAPRLRVA